MSLRSLSLEHNSSSVSPYSKWQPISFVLLIFFSKMLLFGRFSRYFYFLHYYWLKKTCTRGQTNCERARNINHGRTSKQTKKKINNSISSKKGKNIPFSPSTTIILFIFKTIYYSIIIINKRHYHYRHFLCCLVWFD